MSLIRPVPAVLKIDSKRLCSDHVAMWNSLARLASPRPSRPSSRSGKQEDSVIVFARIWDTLLVRLSVPASPADTSSGEPVCAYHARRALYRTTAVPAAGAPGD